MTFGIAKPIAVKKPPVTAADLDQSPVKFEIVRMLLDNMSYAEIKHELKETFGVSSSESALASFKREFFPRYKDIIARWEESRHQYVVTRIINELKETADKRFREVQELGSLITKVDERLRLIETDQERQSAAYEAVFKDYIKTKALLLQRMSEITGGTGVEEKLKEMVKQTALAAQRVLFPWIVEDRRDEVFKLFDQELESLLTLIETGEALKW